MSLSNQFVAAPSPLVSTSLASLSLGQERVVSPQEFKELAQLMRTSRGAMTIVFLRHARSTGNERSEIAKLSDDYKELKEAHDEVHGFLHPLVRVGHLQSHAGGRMLASLCHSGLLPAIDTALFSPQVRPIQTLQGLVRGATEYCLEHGIDIATVFTHGAQAQLSSSLGERYWGDFSRLSKEEQKKAYQDRLDNVGDWTPGTNGERLLEAFSRGRDALAKLHRESYSGKVVLVATHGEMINVFEALLQELDPSGDAMKKALSVGIPNAGMYIVSRVPFSPQMTAPDGSSLGGLHYKMKVVPYLLTANEEEDYGEWAKPPKWQFEAPQRYSLSGFADLLSIPEESRVLADRLATAGVGERSITARA